jgi:oligoribonuclease
MCGSSVQFDRTWLDYWMPEFSAKFHYRNIDTSTVKELCRRMNKKAFAKVPPKVEAHRVIPDLHDTLEEFNHYRAHFLKTR